MRRWSLWSGNDCLHTGTLDAPSDGEAVKAALGLLARGIPGVVVSAEKTYRIRCNGAGAGFYGDEVARTGLASSLPRDGAAVLAQNAREERERVEKAARAVAEGALRDRLKGRSLERAVKALNEDSALERIAGAVKAWDEEREREQQAEGVRRAWDEERERTRLTPGQGYTPVGPFAGTSGTFDHSMDSYRYNVGAGGGGASGGHGRGGGIATGVGGGGVSGNGSDMEAYHRAEAIRSAERAGEREGKGGRYVSRVLMAPPWGTGARVPGAPLRFREYRLEVGKGPDGSYRAVVVSERDLPSP